MLENITMMPIGWLEHHPENPRKDLGDLTELAESIRKQGIMQNLTVVPADGERDGDYYKYWVVIGNRRLEASRLAGIKELPCMVSDMDRGEQVATMLAENMHRADLTLYEQAKGIQMMMDLGFSKDEVEERTGFSRATIDRRLAVAALPDQETKQAVELGYDLVDLVEIAELEDPKKRKELLQVNESEKKDGLNKQQLRQRIRWAKREEQQKKIKKTLVKAISKWAKELDNTEKWSAKYERVPGLTVRIEEGAQVREPTEKGSYYFWVGYTEIEVYRKVKRQKIVKTEADIRMEQRQARAKELNEEMKERRASFVAGLQPSSLMEANLKGQMFKWIFGWKSQYNPGDFYTSFRNMGIERFRKLCGMPRENERDPEESLREEIERRKVPLNRALLAWMLCGGIISDDRTGYANEYNGAHQHDVDLDRVYEVLEFAGYVLTDEEQAWKDGTHPLYRGEIDERGADAGDGTDEDGAEE